MLAVVFGLHQTCGKLALPYALVYHPYHIEVAGDGSVRRSRGRLLIVSNNTYLHSHALLREVVRVLIIAISVVPGGHVCIRVLCVDLVVCYLAVVCSLNRCFCNRRWRLV